MTDIINKWEYIYTSTILFFISSHNNWTLTFVLLSKYQELASKTQRILGIAKSILLVVLDKLPREINKNVTGFTDIPAPPPYFNLLIYSSKCVQNES